jgi:hypothetical protein
VCLESLARDGINVGVGEIADEGKRRSLGVCNGDFLTEAQEIFEKPEAYVLFLELSNFL